ncbi:hypothetical protein [Desulfoferrobacter suflitae]|uniref:hypothetical protein n=1 Tax=Desulfoferrobacter suflitae TaxID=2865782 RepID=UPI002164738F|nr:hypothetical protein [Desulfoferrobacter suflitae]MCK8601590.1 hypothetical protein [Desulfoferrobacter suflitae]
MAVDRVWRASVEPLLGDLDGEQGGCPAPFFEREQKMNQTTARELAFFGRITAGFTHEIKNILAIIKESSGLMEDLLSLTKDEPFPHWERFSHRVEVIKQQVQRGVELATHLNRFAHSPDEPVSPIDLNDLTDQLVRLSERFARLKEVGLTRSGSNASIVLVTSPVALQMTVFLLLESCWNQMPAGSAMELRAEWRERHPCLLVRMTVPVDDLGAVKQHIATSEGFTVARQSAHELGGQMLDDIPDGFALLFTETRVDQQAG